MYKNIYTFQKLCRLMCANKKYINVNKCKFILKNVYKCK